MSTNRDRENKKRDNRAARRRIKREQHRPPSSLAQPPAPRPIPATDPPIVTRKHPFKRRVPSATRRGESSDSGPVNNPVRSLAFGPRRPTKRFPKEEIIFSDQSTVTGANNYKNNIFNDNIQQEQQATMTSVEEEKTTEDND